MNKDKTIPKLWDNKVDKGGYTGTAQNLKSEIDSKVSKSGDTMTGGITFNYNNQNFRIGTNEWGGVIGGPAGSQYLELSKSGNFTVRTPKDIKLISESGETAISAKTLRTNNKEVVAAINEVNDKADTKVSKNGDTMTGELRIKKGGYPQVLFYNNDRQVAGVGYDSGNSAVYLMAGNSDDQKIRIFENGKAWYPAKDLNTGAKNVVGAINEIHGDGLLYRGVIGDDNITISDIIELKPGVYTTNEANIEGIKVRGWYTIKKFRHKNLDQNVIVENSGFPGNYYMGAFNNQKFTGWASYSSDSNYAPYTIGDVYTTTRSENPATRWLGTTWIKLGDQNIGGTTVYCWKRNS